MMSGFTRMIALLGVVFSVAGGKVLHAQTTYPIGPGDVIQVSILSKPALDRELTVDLDGTVYVPLIGAVTVLGQTIEQLRTDIPSLMTGAVYRERIDGESVLVSIANDEVLVDIASYRPIYVDGEVQQAGELPFSVGISVRQAIAAAQGFALPDQGGRALLEEHPLAIQARLAAVQAEMVYFRAIAYGEDKIDPVAFADIGGAAGPAAALAARMDQRLETANAIAARQLEGLDQSIARVSQRIVTARETERSIRAIEQLARAKSERLEDLAGRGFATPDALAASWDDYLNVVERLRRAEEGLEALEDSRRELILEREIAQNVRREEAHRRLVELDATAVDLAARLRVLSASALENEGTSVAEAEYVYTIFRTSGDQYLQIEANPGTLLMPGDVLNVRPTLSPLHSLQQLSARQPNVLSERTND